MVRSPTGGCSRGYGSNFAPRALHLVETIAHEVVTPVDPVGDSFVGVAFDPGGERLYVGGGKGPTR